MRTTVRHAAGRAYGGDVRVAGKRRVMEREANEDQGRRDGDRARIDNAGGDAIELDDREFASVDDTGPEPAENPQLDDV